MSLRVLLYEIDPRCPFVPFHDKWHMSAPRANPSERNPVVNEALAGMKAEPWTVKDYLLQYSGEEGLYKEIFLLALSTYQLELHVAAKKYLPIFFFYLNASNQFEILVFLKTNKQTEQTLPHKNRFFHGSYFNFTALYVHPILHNNIMCNFVWQKKTYKFLMREFHKQFALFVIFKMWIKQLLHFWDKSCLEYWMCAVNPVQVF